MTQAMQRTILKMTPQEKRELVEYINETLAKANADTRYSQRCSNLMEEIGGILDRKIDYISRDNTDVWARAMVAYQMIEEGYTLAEIGRQMLKDHSTIYHLKTKIQDVIDYPNLFKDIYPVWIQFQNKIKQ